jgi:anti-anti-sigma regulatory factor
MSTAEPSGLDTAFDGGLLKLSGRLGIEQAGALQERLRGRIEAVQRIDLGGLDAIDSAGVASLRLLQKKAIAAGRTLELRPLSERFRAICAAHRIVLADTAAEEASA